MRMTVTGFLGMARLYGGCDGVTHNDNESYRLCWSGVFSMARLNRGFGGVTHNEDDSLGLCWIGVFLVFGYRFGGGGVGVRPSSLVSTTMPSLRMPARRTRPIISITLP